MSWRVFVETARELELIPSQFPEQPGQVLEFRPYRRVELNELARKKLEEQEAKENLTEEEKEKKLRESYREFRKHWFRGDFRAKCRQLKAFPGTERVDYRTYFRRIFEDKETFPVIYGTRYDRRGRERKGTLCRKSRDDIFKERKKNYLYLSYQEFYRNRYGGKTLKGVRAIVVDIDHVTSAVLPFLLQKLMEKLPLPPSYVVNSGKGLHLVFALKWTAPARNNRWSLEQLNKTITEAVGKVVREVAEEVVRRLVDYVEKNRLEDLYPDMDTIRRFGTKNPHIEFKTLFPNTEEMVPPPPYELFHLYRTRFATEDEAKRDVLNFLLSEAVPHLDRHTLVQPYRFPGFNTKVGESAAAFSVGPHYGPVELADAFGVKNFRIADPETGKVSSSRKNKFRKKKKFSGRRSLKNFFRYCLKRLLSELPSPGNRHNSFFAFGVVAYKARADVPLQTALAGVRSVYREMVRRELTYRFSEREALRSFQKGYTSRYELMKWEKFLTFFDWKWSPQRRRSGRSGSRDRMPKSVQLTYARKKKTEKKLKRWKRLFPEIQQLQAQGLSRAEIARRLGISRTTLYAILKSTQFQKWLKRRIKRAAEQFEKLCSDLYREVSGLKNKAVKKVSTVVFSHPRAPDPVPG